MKRISRQLIPFLFLLLVELVLVLSNYTSGTFLMGWDNVMPEFNFSLNLKRSIFAVWQGYRGLGHIDSMSHAANILHTVTLWVMSFILPIYLLRYTFHFGMHFAGAVGMYLLLGKVFNNIVIPTKRQRVEGSSSTNFAELDSSTVLRFARNDKNTLGMTKIIPILGALFYQLNFVTIQMFYTPLEAFSVHFAALPFLALTLIKYLQKPTRKHFVLFLLVLILSTPQFFVSTLILPVFFLIVSILGSFLLFKKTTLRRCLRITASFFVVNAFWLLPFIYGAVTNAATIAEAKINQMSSKEIFFRNKVFGDTFNVLTLHGFSLNFVDLNADRISHLMMQPWRDHLYQIVPTVISITFAVVMLTGLFVAIRLLVRKSHEQPMFNKEIVFPFILSFLFAISMLGNNIPVLRELMNLLRTTIPFFGEAYRFPFTKFSLLFSFSYTVFFTVGIYLVAILFKAQRLRQLFLVIFSTGIFFLSLPAFSGNFFYPQLKVVLPKSYLQLFSYLHKQVPESERIVSLPAFEYWSWKYYRWGYRGSGFLWQGIPQPLMDRAFDPWSNFNENFYWELSYAIYRKDPELLGNVFDKYNVTLALFDNSLISAGQNRALFNEEIKTLLRQISFQPLATFGDLVLYQKANKIISNLVAVFDKLPTVFPAYVSSNNDRAYKQFSTYVNTNNDNEANIIYPFRALSTVTSSKKTREFVVFENGESFIFRSTLVNDNNGKPIQSGTYDKNEKLVFDANKNNELNAIKVTSCGSLIQSGKSVISDEYSGQNNWLHFSSLNTKNCLSFGLGNLSHNEGYLIAIESRNLAGTPLRVGLINRTAKHTEIEADLPRESNWITTYFILPPLAQDGLGYDIYITNNSIGADLSENDIGNVRVYSFPYEELLNFHLPTDMNSLAVSQSAIAEKLFSSLYKVTFTKNLENNVALWQAYDPGWLALQKTNSFPFLKPVGKHVLVNNWANGWQLKKSQIISPNDQTTVYLFFWPQILQWVGFGLLPLPFILLLRRKH